MPWITPEGTIAESHKNEVVFDAETQSPALESLIAAPCVVLPFASYTDGRAFSWCAKLKRMGYSGDIVASGELGLDRLNQAFRCGFSIAWISDEEQKRLKQIHLKPFSHSYQQIKPQQSTQAFSIELLNQRLVNIASAYKDIRLALSLGAEDMLLLHVAAALKLPIIAFVLDTGRLHEESLDFLTKVQETYSLPIRLFAPKHELLQDYYAKYGVNAFYRSIELRKSCCYIRKVEPLSRALAGADCWITGQRREQSITRTNLEPCEFDHIHNIAKCNPLAELDSKTLWQLINQLGVLTHPLHSQNMPSIGCAPCTRAIKPGEDERSGRWWWEEATHKECGLHKS